MTKTKDKKESSTEVEELKPLEFVAGEMKDGLLNYSYKIKTGAGVGNTHNVKGDGLFEDDLTTAFAKLNVHLAAIDDIFKHNSVEVEKISKMRTHELTFLFTVTGFTIKGEDENRSVILKGTKRIAASHDWMDIKTPKIDISKLSSYMWHSDLRKVLEEVLEECELYHEGKCTPQEHEEKVDKNQLSIADGMDEEEEAVFEKGRK